MSAGESALKAHVDVSRETLDRLDIYAALIRKWNPTINLVAKSTLDDLWDRHFFDSAAAYTAANPKSGRWVDMGSGGGFPGAVVAILAAELAPELQNWSRYARWRAIYQFLRYLITEKIQLLYTFIKCGSQNGASVFWVLTAKQRSSIS